MKKNTFYLDMDGVVADWTGSVDKILGYHLSTHDVLYPQEDWEKLKEYQRFYRDLDLLPQANQLVNLARQFRDKLGWNLLFLTAIPHENDFHWAIWDKCEWAQRHFPDIPVHFGPYAKDKHVHCEAGDILVDDRHSNIVEWREAGGIGIEVYKDDAESALIQVRMQFDFRR
jgi:hypothetical protein